MSVFRVGNFGNFQRLTIQTEVISYVYQNKNLHVFVLSKIIESHRATASGDAVGCFVSEQPN